MKFTLICFLAVVAFGSANSNIFGPHSSATLDGEHFVISGENGHSEIIHHPEEEPILLDENDVIVSGQSYSIVKLPNSHSNPNAHPNNQKPDHPDNHNHTNNGKGPHGEHPAKPTHEKCGNDGKFFDDGNGVHYRFPSGGNTPRISLTYRDVESNKKLADYTIAFKNVYFRNFFNDTDEYLPGKSGKNKMTRVSLPSFQWQWENCSIMELEDSPGTYYYSLLGQNYRKCIQAELYISFTVDTNSSTSILKVIVSLSNLPDCKYRTFSELLTSYNTVGVEFQYMCHDFGEEADERRCQVEEYLEDINELSETLTYNSSTLSQTLMAHTACWGERDDNMTIEMEPLNQTCYPAGPINRFGIGWPIDDEGAPRNQAQYRLEVGYDSSAVTDYTVVNIDPFSFQFTPETTESPVFPYTPSCLETTAGDDAAAIASHIEQSVVNDFPLGIPDLEEAPLLEEEGVDLNDAGVAEVSNKVPEAINQEIIYDTTARDVSLAALVVFLIVSLVLTFVLARKAENPTV